MKILRLGSNIWRVMVAVVTVAVILWVLLAGWGGRFDPRQWALPAMFTLSYPMALMACVVVLVVTLCSRMWWWSAALLLAQLSTWPALHVNVPFHVGSTEADKSRTFSLVTFNVSGFYNMQGVPDKMASIHYILDRKADFVLLQEATLDAPDFLEFPLVAPVKDKVNRLYPYHAHGYHDLMILSRYPYTVHTDTTFRHEFADSSYHYYAKVFDVQLPQQHQLRIINLHLQSIGLSADDKQLYQDLTHLGNAKDKASQARQAKSSLMGKLARAYRARAREAELIRRLVDESPECVIVCGDFNDTPASYTYWTIRGDDLRDAYAQQGLGFAHTFNSSHMLFKIDHVLYRGPLRAVDFKRHKSGASDHYPQQVTFEWLPADIK